MSAAGTTSTGDKVTLALLAQKLDAVIDGQHEVLETIKDITKTIHRLDNEQCVQAEKVSAIEDDLKENIHPDIKRLSKLEWAIGALGIVGNAIAGWLGVKN